MSHYNYKSLVVRTKHGDKSEEYASLMASTDNVDTPLHPIGEKQCEANKDAVHCLNAKYVLVSPMRRAM
jgi:broad specificity phosphatase PhoE